jgi:hypothetical protein
MSLIHRDRATVMRYAYTRLAESGDIVKVYVRQVEDEESGYNVPEYIATGEDSDTPEGATIEEIVSPQSTPLYDNIHIHAWRGERCC